MNITLTFIAILAFHKAAAAVKEEAKSEPAKKGLKEAYHGMDGVHSGMIESTTSPCERCPVLETQLAEKTTEMESRLRQKSDEHRQSMDQLQSEYDKTSKELVVTLETKDKLENNLKIEKETTMELENKNIDKSKTIEDNKIKKMAAKDEAKREKKTSKHQQELANNSSAHALKQELALINANNEIGKLKLELAQLKTASKLDKAINSEHTCTISAQTTAIASLNHQLKDLQAENFRLKRGQEEVAVLHRELEGRVGRRMEEGCGGLGGGQTFTYIGFFFIGLILVGIGAVGYYKKKRHSSVDVYRHPGQPPRSLRQQHAVHPPPPTWNHGQNTQDQ